MQQLPEQTGVRLVAIRMTSLYTPSPLIIECVEKCWSCNMLIAVCTVVNVQYAASTLERMESLNDAQYSI